MTPRKVIIPHKTGNVSTAAARKAVEVVMRQQPATKPTAVGSGNESYISTKVIEQYLGKFGTSVVRVQSGSKGLAAKVPVKKTRGR